jgi:hypothetical protein
MRKIISSKSLLLLAFASAAAFAGAVQPPPLPGGGPETTICQLLESGLLPPGSEADYDHDGIPDLCDADADGDGVPNTQDACLATELGAAVDENGCSVLDLNPCDNGWKNHGAYVRAVVQTAEDFVARGLIDADGADAVVSEAARSSCGK